MAEKKCWCGSGRRLKDCCGPILDGERPAGTAEALMRSRYSANVVNNTAYLLASWHPSTRPRSLDGEQRPDWCGLTVLAVEGGAEDETEGMVEFRATFRVGGREQVLHERSRFVREKGRWLYVDGDLVPDRVKNSPKIGRNAPCPCGSGKKYKKCCFKKQ